MFDLLAGSSDEQRLPQVTFGEEEELGQQVGGQGYGLVAATTVTPQTNGLDSVRRTILTMPAQQGQAPPVATTGGAAGGATATLGGSVVPPPAQQ